MENMFLVHGTFVADIANAKVANSSLCILTSVIISQKSYLKVFNAIYYFNAKSHNLISLMLSLSMSGLF